MSISFQIVVLISLLINGLYFSALIRILMAWKDKDKLIKVPDLELPSVSIIIAFRNEENHLPTLLSSFSHLNYPAELFEFIFVDDHSEDNSSGIVSSWLVMNAGIKGKMIDLKDKLGKKNALKAGVEMAGMEYLLFTDADCFMSPEWVNSMVQHALLNKSLLVLGPVLFHSSNKMLHHFQQIEMFGLQAVTAGMAFMGKAVMGNGANLLVKREIYLQLIKDLKTGRTASGDDVFLVHAMKKERGSASISYAYARAAVVWTYPEESLSTLFTQHIRWAAKSKSYSDKETLLLGLKTLLANGLVVFLFIAAWTGRPLLILFIAVMLSKSTMDYLLARKASTLNEYPINGIDYLVSAFLYPFFSILIIIFSLSGKNHWKGRPIK